MRHVADRTAHWSRFGAFVFVVLMGAVGLLILKVDDAADDKRFKAITDQLDKRVDVNAELLREQETINLAVCEGQNEDRAIMRQILESSKRTPANINNPQAQARLDGLIALAPPKDCHVITNGSVTVPTVPQQGE